MKSTKRQSRRAQLLFFIFTIILLLSMTLGLVVNFRTPPTPTATPGGVVSITLLL